MMNIKAMKDFVLNEVDFSLYAANGRKYFEQNFTKERFMKNLTNLLK